MSLPRDRLQLRLEEGLGPLHVWEHVLQAPGGCLPQQEAPACLHPAGQGHSGHPVEEVGWAVRVKAGPSHTLTPG